MRPIQLVLVYAVVAASLACSRPEYLVADPESVSFERAGETRAVSVKGMNRQGISFPKVMVAWTTKDPKVATVERGIIKSVGHGRTTIEVSMSSGVSAEIPVDVILVGKVVTKQKELLFSMEPPAGQKLDVSAYDPEGREVRNRAVNTKCKDQEVCSSTGDTVFPLNPGKTTVEVSVDNKTTEVPVTVVEHAKQLDALRKKEGH